VVVDGSPVVKFYGQGCHFFVFTLLYTYVGVLLNPAEYTPAEGIMHVWLLPLVLSELRNAVASGLNRWSADFWNLLYAAFMFAYVLAAISRGVELYGVQMPPAGVPGRSEQGRTVPLSELGGYNSTDGSYGALGHRVAAVYRQQFEDMLQARGLHGAVGILLWARLLKVFTVDAEFGPLELTFLAMVRDVSRFALLQLVFSTGFAAALLCAARPYPDRRLRCNSGEALGDTYDTASECAAACDGQCKTQLWRGLTKSVSDAYFQIYGEHFLGAKTLPLLSLAP
jgi:hypothetical protein